MQNDSNKGAFVSWIKHERQLFRAVYCVGRQWNVLEPNQIWKLKVKTLAEEAVFLRNDSCDKRTSVNV